MPPETPARPACCAPSAPHKSKPIAPPCSTAKRRLPADAKPIPGGTALVGTNTPQIPDDGEGPLRRVKVKPFLMAATTVTNTQFANFVAATSYKTEAERYGWSFVFWDNLPDSMPPTRAVQGIEWWRKVEGAYWNDPAFTATQPQPDHPVTHISWNDAQAYAKWVGGRLPTEVEWEHAARGGQGDVRFAWGADEPTDTNATHCNIWQGDFPQTNTSADGFAATAPAQSFAPNSYGLYNMCGNVWEWTADPYRIKSLKKQARQRLASMRGFKLLKGGSYLCHQSYCYRYRIAARSGNSPESTTSHQGLRVVWSV